MGKECICTLAQQLCGDGCDVCNPEHAAKYEMKADGGKCPLCGSETVSDAFGNKECSLFKEDKCDWCD